MHALGPAYLIHGDDHGAVSERRARLRAVAEAAGAATDIEVLQGADATPGAVASALSSPTLGLGQRVIVVDGVERWKDADVTTHLAPALAQMPPDTTVAMFAFEDARAKAPTALHNAVKQAGGNVAREARLSAEELPRWVIQQAQRMHLSLDSQAAATLVEQVGQRRQRLLRELEKLALGLGEADAPGSSELRLVSAEEIRERAANSSQSEVFALADALVSGAPAHALGTYVRLRSQGERLPGLMALMASRLRQALNVTERLQAGEPVAAVRRTLHMPNVAAQKLLADAAKTDPQRLRRALAVLADLELHTRGGPVVHSLRPPASALDEETQAVRAIETIAAANP
jgi:DNA polymerase-3 subunit delta